MEIMRTHKVSKRFPGVLALNGVDLVVETGKIHCIVGENGAGKSTLIKILTGLYEPDEGDVFIDGKSARLDSRLFGRVAYVPQELDQFENMTVADNLFMPLQSSDVNSFLIRKSRLQSLAVPWLEKFQISAGPEQLARDISVSEQQLLQIARGMVNDSAQILLLDEPTTSLTTKDTQRLFEVVRQLKDSGKAIIFISHKIEEIFQLADEITVLRNGEKVAHSRAEEVDIAWVIRQMVGREIDQTISYASENVSDEVLLDVENLTGDIFSGVGFQLRKGEILGFSGLVGSGRSEVMQAILGYLPVWSGSVLLDGKSWKFGDTHFSVENGYIYLPEERKRQGILPYMSVRKNLTISLLEQVSNRFALSGKREAALSREIVEAYNIKAASLEQQIRFLSGGNQQKVIIGRSMYSRPKVLVFDEPTKGIDVGTKTEIYRLMKKLAEETGIGIILISSEIEEVMRCANRIATMYNGRLAGIFDTANNDKSAILNSIIGVA